MKRSRRPHDTCGSKTLDSVRNVFYVRDCNSGEKLSTRIIINGEAGSGKSVFCLKLVESWRRVKQSGKHEHLCEKHSEQHEHLCEKHSELKCKLNKGPKLLWLLNQLRVRDKENLSQIVQSDRQDTGRRQGSFEEHSELFRRLQKDWEVPQLCSDGSRSQLSRLPEIPCTACGMNLCLSEFDLLYYVPLRDATEGKTSVLDLVCDAVCYKRQNMIARTKRLMDSDNIRCLIILDGVDEWQNPPGFTGLPKSDGLSMKCVLLWTMRPWKLVHLELKPKQDDHIVTVSGLMRYSIAKLIENILIRFYGLKGEKLKSKFLAYCKKVTDKTLAGMRMPMMLIAACHLWHTEKAKNSKKSSDTVKSVSKTHLYLSLLDLMIQNAARKQSKQGSTEQNLAASLLNDLVNNPPTHSDLPEILKTFSHVSHFIDMLLPFCELAFTDLMSAKTKLVFNKGQLERRIGKSHVDLAHRMGLISQAKVRSEIGRLQNVSVSFYHKSVQELLAAMYMTCGNQDAVSSFCGYCSTFEKVMETANVTMFVLGLDPSLGCRICEHITNIVNSDQDITEYRRTLDNRTGGGRVLQLYRAQCEWYRELRHNRTVTGNTSPPPSIRVTDISLYYGSDSDTVRLTGDQMCSNLETIVSVTLNDVLHPLHGVAHLLPKCPNLSVLCITYMYNKENLDLLVSVIPRLTQLNTVRYYYEYCPGSYANVVAAVMSLTQLERIELGYVRLGDDVVKGTDAMTRLRTVVLHHVFMTAGTWAKFVSSLLNLPQSVSVVLHKTNIDEGTVRRIHTSPHVTVTRDVRARYESMYGMLNFTTVPSQTTL